MGNNCMKKGEKGEGKETTESEDNDNKRTGKTDPGIGAKFIKNLDHSSASASASATTTGRGSGEDNIETIGTGKTDHGSAAKWIKNKDHSSVSATATGRGSGEDNNETIPPGRPGLLQPGAEHENKAMSSQSSIEMDGNVWLLDCREAMHHTSNARLLDGIVGSLPSLLYDDDDNRIAGPVRGSVRTERFKVLEVTYVEGDSSRNVISVAQLARRHGLVTVFEPTCAYVRDPATEEEVGRACQRDGVYVLDFLRINQDVVDARLSQAMSNEELQGGVSELNLEYPAERGSWFGMSSGSDRSIRDSTAGVFHMSPHDEQQHGTRTKEFYIDSGARHHMTWNGDVLKAYPADLNMETPTLQSATSVVSELSRPRAVGGIGYIDSKGGSLDCVLFVPDSSVNLVSVSQLTEDHSVRVVFRQQEFLIEKLESNETIGHGQWVGTNYVVAVFDVGAASNWILDTFAWLHHTADRRLLRSIKQDVPDLAVGLLQTKRYNIPNVQYIPTNRMNVISVAQLARDHGLVTVLEPTCCHVKVKESGKIVARGCLCKGVYVLDYLIINIYQSITQVQDGGSGSSAQGGRGSSSGGAYEGHGGGAQGGQAAGQGDGNEGGGGQDGGDQRDDDDEEEEEEEEEAGEELEEDEEGPPSFLFGELQDYMDIDGVPSHRLLPEEAFQELTTVPRTNEFFVCSRAPSYHVTWNAAVLFRYPAYLHDSSRSPIDTFDGVFGSDNNNGVSPIIVTDTGYLNGNNVMLDAVLLAPDSQMNMISVRQLEQQYGVTLELDGEGIKIMKNFNGQNHELGRGLMNGSSQYVLEGFYPQPAVLYAHSPGHNYNFYRENFFGPVPQ